MDTGAFAFSEQEKAGLYRAISERRDMRRFRPDPIPPATLVRILEAAHHAPSVGLMQPWNFLLIADRAIRTLVRDAFIRANKEESEHFEGQRAALYSSLKLEGILDSPINLCVTCDRDRFGPVVLGRTCQPNTDLFSTVCAVQNLWLAARAEGVGVGWVSILRLQDLADILNLPSQVIPVAYLCLGYVDHFPREPELVSRGWLPRLELKDLVRFNTWQGICEDVGLGLEEQLRVFVQGES